MAFALLGGQPLYRRCSGTAGGSANSGGFIEVGFESGVASNGGCRLAIRAASTWMAAIHLFDRWKTDRGYGRSEPRSQIENKECSSPKEKVAKRPTGRVGSTGVDGRFRARNGV